MPDEVTSSTRSGVVWRLLLLVGMVALISLGIRLSTTGVGIDTDVQAILPQTASNGADIAAIRHAGASISSRISIGVRGGDAPARRAAAAALEDQLAATGLFIPAAADLTETLAWTRANRYELTCALGPSDMNGAWGADLAQKARIALFSGVVPLSGADISTDPFLLDFHQLSCLGPDTSAPDEAIVAGRLNASPFALDVQRQIATALSIWQDDERHKDLTLLRSGTVFFAEAAGAQAKREISLVGGVSVVLILLLYGMSFRSLRTAGLALLTVAAGATGGAWACFVIFGTVHFSVFVFGSALTGVSADYAVHTFAARRAGGLGARDGQGKGNNLRRALTISMATSAAGFAALLVFNIALFMQIGVFAIGGLATAWLFAISALPRLDHVPAMRQSVRVSLLGVMRRFRHWAGRPRVGWVVLAAVAAVFGAALPKLEFVDDLRRFQTLSPILTAEQNALFPDAKGRFSSQFLLSSGDDLEAALLAEEQALVKFGSAASRFMAYSRFNPSRERRAQTRAAYEAHLFAPHFSQLQAQLGLPPTVAPTPNSDATVPAWLTALHFERGDRTYLLAPMLEGADPDSALADSRLINPALVYGRTLRNYRESAASIFGVAALFAALFLALINRQARAALLIAPPIMGCALAIAIPSLLGAPVTLFSVLALFIVLGAGIDFSVFQWEMSGDHSGWTGAAVVIAAFSTCAAMGMLGFSATLPVQSFGLTIAIGVLGAMVFSFMTPQRAPDTKLGGNHAQDL